MGLHQLIPSSWVLEGDAAEFLLEDDGSEALTNTNSNTSSMLICWFNDDAGYLCFDFSSLPYGPISSIEIKIKTEVSTGNNNTYSGYAQLVSAPNSDGIALSDRISLAQTKTVYTITPTVDLATLVSYKDTLAIKFNGSGGTEVYGAEINVVVAAVPNKVIFGDITLIDLTQDTATVADVVSGKTFHLADGEQAIGTFSPSMRSKSKTLSSGASGSIAFSGLLKEPDAFFLVPSTQSGSNAKFTTVVYYNGTSTKAGTARASSNAAALAGVSSASFTYSSGTLTITLPSGYPMIKGDWVLYYI